MAYLSDFPPSIFWGPSEDPGAKEVGSGRWWDSLVGHGKMRKKGSALRQNTDKEKAVNDKNKKVCDPLLSVHRHQCFHY